MLERFPIEFGQKEETEEHAATSDVDRNASSISLVTRASQCLELVLLILQMRLVYSFFLLK